MFCAKCGKEIAGTEKFCQNCGNPVAAAATNEPIQEVQPQPQVQPQVPPQQPYGQPQYTQQPPQQPYGQQQPPQQSYAQQPPQQPYGQPQYAQPPQQPYGQPQYGQPQYGMPPKKSGKGLKIAIISIVAVLVIGGGIFGALTLLGGNSPKAAVQNAYDALLDKDAETFLENTVLNEDAFKVLFDEEYDKDTYIDLIETGMDSMDDEDMKEASFEVEEFEIMEEDDYNDYLDMYENTYEDTAKIENVAIVTVRFMEDADDKGETSEVYCYEIDGKWYMLYSTYGY